MIEFTASERGVEEGKKRKKEEEKERPQALKAKMKCSFMKTGPGVMADQREKEKETTTVLHNETAAGWSGVCTRAHSNTSLAMRPKELAATSAERAAAALCLRCHTIRL